MALVAHDTARVGVDSAFGHDGRDLEGQVGPGEVGAVLKAPVPQEAHVGLEAVAFRGGVAAIAIKAVAADGHPAVEALAHPPHPCLQALAAKAARLGTHAPALIGPGEGYEVHLAA